MLMETVPMIDPSGESGEVLMRDVEKARKQGYRMATKLFDLNHKIVIVANDDVALYLSAGFTIDPS